MLSHRRPHQEHPAYLGRVGKGALRHLGALNQEQVLLIFESGVALLDRNTGSYLWEVERPVECALYSQNRLFLGREELTAIDLASGEEVVLGDHDGERIRHLALHPQRPVLVSAGEDFQLRFWDLEQNQQLLALEGYSGPLAFRPDGQVLLACRDERVEALDTGSRIPLYTLPSPHGSTYFLNFDNAGERFCSGDQEGHLRIWDAANGELVMEHEGQGVPLTQARFSASGLRVAAADEAGQLSLFSTVDASPLPGPEPLDEPIESLDFLSESELVYATTRRGFVWGAEPRTLFEHRDWIVCVAFAPDGEVMATGGLDGEVWVQNSQSESCVARHQDAVLNLRFRDDGQMLASSGQDGQVCLMARDGSVLWTQSVSQGAVPHLHFFADHLLGIDDNGRLKLLSLESGEVVVETAVAEGGLENSYVEPRSGRLALLHDDGTLHLWALKDLFL